MAVHTTTITVVGSSITLGTPVPVGSVGALNYFFMWRLRGSQTWNQVYAKVSAGVVWTRAQTSARNIEFFIRTLDSTGAIFDTAVSTMFLLNSAAAYTYTELQTPQLSKVGETVKSTAFSYQLLRGAMVPGSIINPSRVVVAPLGSSMTHTQTAKLFTSNTVALLADSGTRHHDFAFGV